MWLDRPSPRRYAASMSVNIGDIVGGRYTIEKALAEGGMGAVYVARDSNL